MPGGTLGTFLGYLWSQSPKNIKKPTVGGPILEPFGETKSMQKCVVFFYRPRLHFWCDFGAHAHQNTDRYMRSLEKLWHAFGLVITISNSRSTPQHRTQNRFKEVSKSHAILMISFSRKQAAKVIKLWPIFLSFLLSFSGRVKNRMIGSSLASRRRYFWPWGGKGGTCVATEEISCVATDEISGIATIV